MAVITNSTPTPTPDFNGYKNLYESMVINPKKLNAVKEVANAIKQNVKAYVEISEAITKLHYQVKIPWQFIGLVHKMECDLSFKHHLHNGDPLTHRTTHVPAGRPLAGNPPFTFEESAIDALTNPLQSIPVWDISYILYRLEKYNGFGYRQWHNMNSPYLWSFTNHYTIGKYNEDGHFDPKMVSDQIGAAPVLKLIWGY